MRSVSLFTVVVVSFGREPMVSGGGGDGLGEDEGGGVASGRKI